MEKIILPSGNILQIGLLSLEASWNVLQIVSKVVEELKLDISEFKFLGQKDFTPQDFISLKSPICFLLSNQEIVEASKICFEQCLYRGLKVDSKSFDSKENRGDYIPAMFYAIKENVSPFFGSLISSLVKKSNKRDQATDLK